MTATDLHYLGLVEVGQKIQAKALSPVEATKAMLQRIEKLDGQLKSFAYVMADSALADATTAEQEIASGKIKGVLHGVPVAVKDLCWAKGAPAAHGMTIHRDFRPTEDATVVARLKDAGAIILGKLQQTEGAYADHHPKIDPPKNPWNADLWPGASSSGSGVATAAGCQLAASCDLIVASETARFGVNGINLGLFCSTPAVALSRRVAPGAAFELLTTGDFLSAARAQALGLVTRLAPPDRLPDVARQLAESIAAKDPAAIRLGKRAFQAQLGQPLPDAYRLAGAIMVENVLLSDTARGIQAFLDRP
jgi:hypothetical protein